MENPLVRHNLLTQKNYSPYCGQSPNCPAGMVRTKFIDDQFECRCGWRSEFPDDFIVEYKEAKVKLDQV